MGWVANKRQQIRRNGEYVWVNPGDPLPEAEFWPNRSAHVRQKMIREVAMDTPMPPKKVVAPPQPTLPGTSDEPSTPSPKPAGKKTAKGKGKKG
jgi:hypothetical protein